MKVGIIGLPKSGKTTVFNALTGSNAKVSSFSLGDLKPNIAQVKVPDLRMTQLCQMYSPKSVVLAEIEFIDMVGIRGSGVIQGFDMQFLSFIKDVDAIVEVIRIFEDEGIIHPQGSVEPQRDVKIIESEILLSDMERVEKRCESLSHKKVKKTLEDERNEILLNRCKQQLELEQWLKDLELKEDEHKILNSLQLLTTKPVILVANIGENDLNINENPKMKDLVGYAKMKGIPLISLCGKVEMEIKELSEDEQGEFLSELGISEPSINPLIRICYEALGLISFFTAGKKEVKAWTIPKGTSALKASGKIHSDIERGFIRAEVIKYDDLISAGSKSHARDKGLIRLEGKEYLVCDGDVIEFRFNV